MRQRAEAIWIVFGAIVGGMIVGGFRLEPGWLWGMLGGAGGGLTGGLAGHLAGRPWHPALRAAAAVSVLAAGFFGLWLLAGRQFVLDSVQRSLGG